MSCSWCLTNSIVSLLLQNLAPAVRSHLTFAAKATLYDEKFDLACSFRFHCCRYPEKWTQWKQDILVRQPTSGMLGSLVSVQDIRRFKVQCFGAVTSYTCRASLLGHAIRWTIFALCKHLREFCRKNNSATHPSSTGQIRTKLEPQFARRMSIKWRDFIRLSYGVFPCPRQRIQGFFPVISEDTCTFFCVSVCGCARARVCVCGCYVLLW
jgi:hypothetical protein